MNSLAIGVLSAPAGPLVVPAAQPELFLSLIVPTFNESENIGDFLTALRETLDLDNYEVIVVDDDSPDGTWEIAAARMSDYPQLRVVRRRQERGLATAVIRGWQVARGEVLGTINADFQHPPAMLPQMIQLIQQADLVVASRFAEGGALGDWALRRRISSKGASALGRIILPQVFGRIFDPLSGCYLLRREAVAGVELHPLGYKTLMEIMVRGRIRTIREASYEMRARQRGHSKVSARHFLQYFHHLLRLRRAARRKESQV